MFNKRNTHQSVVRAILAALVAIAAQPAFALQLAGGDINSTNPSTGSSPYVFNSGTFAQPLPWDNVGHLNQASAIYLGDIDNNGTFWVMTAYHDAPSLPSSAVFASGTYGTVAGSWVQLKNPDNSNADIVLFRLNVTSNPGDLTTLSLESTTPPPGTDIYSIGFGNGTTTPGPERWGCNPVAGYGYDNDGFANMAYYYTDYSSSSPNPNTSLGILGDSGGGGFVYDSATQSWQLAGMMFAADSSSTASADIAQYRNQIILAVPEPGNMALLFLGGSCLFLVKIFRRRPARA